MVEDFRTHPLDTGPCLYVSCDGLTMKVREGGWVVETSGLLVTGVSADGYRQILGMQVATSESLAGTLCTIHNLQFMIQLVDNIRKSIDGGYYEAYRDEFMGRYYANKK